MRYSEVVNYLRDTSKGLGYDVTFFHGRTPNAQLVKNIKTIYVMLLPFKSRGTGKTSTSNVDETYNLNMIVYMQDRVDSGINRNASDVLQKEMEILDQTWYIATQLERKIDDNNITPKLQRASDLLQLKTFDKEASVKDTAMLLTGTTINMTIKIPDQFNYCC